MITIGPYKLDSQVIIAPMAGVTDLPFRQLYKKQGAALVVAEMLTADSRLWNSRKSRQRLDHSGETEPRYVQIAGGDTAMLASAALLSEQRGAQIIDINMGCPARKVCKKAAGSALMRDEKLVAKILTAVVAAVDVPVTLKMRSGWSPEQRNAVSIARIAEDCGIAALSVHGRTRACGFKGEAEYDTIAAVVDAVDLPVFANGDIDSPQKAHQVLQYTGANAVMIGRAAQGRPWIAREIDHFLRNNVIVAAPTPGEVQSILLSHLNALYAFYGEFLGVKIARKHLGWYLKEHHNSDDFRRTFNRLEHITEQQQAIENYFGQLTIKEEIAA